MTGTTLTLLQAVIVVVVQLFLQCRGSQDVTGRGYNTPCTWFEMFPSLLFHNTIHQRMNEKIYSDTECLMNMINAINETLKNLLIH